MEPVRVAGGTGRGTPYDQAVGGLQESHAGRARDACSSPWSRDDQTWMSLPPLETRPSNVRYSQTPMRFPAPVSLRFTCSSIYPVPPAPPGPQISPSSEIAMSSNSRATLTPPSLGEITPNLPSPRAQALGAGGLPPAAGLCCRGYRAGWHPAVCCPVAPTSARQMQPRGDTSGRRYHR